MFAADLRPRPSFERQIQRAGMLCLQIVRHHYFSLVSACILGVALFLALTSAPIEKGGLSTSQAASATASSSPDTTSSGAQVRPAPPSLLIYYIVGSEQQKNVMEAAVQSDAAYRMPTGISSSPETSRHFLVVQNPVEAAAAAEVLDDVGQMAPAQGYELHVVDMR